MLGVAQNQVSPPSIESSGPWHSGSLAGVLQRLAELDCLARAAALCTEAHLYQRNGSWVWRGDPTDVALRSFAHKAGWTREEALDRYPQVNQIPFEPERKFAATFHDTPAGVLMLVKGAPERVLELCVFRADAAADRVVAEARALAGEGYRVLALAEGLLPGPPRESDTPPEPENLRFLGFAGMIDPLRPGVKQAVRDCLRAGIGVTMITGDHPATALAIARTLDLASTADEVLTGVELARLTPAEMAALVSRIRVFARVAPQQKLAIVEAAREAGHFVAVTGDGVNDAPALRAAHIGVAMGRSGTDVAHEASDLVVTDDNFATIVAGVEEGRTAYDNIRNVIYLLVSTGAAEVVLVVLSLAAGLPLPLLPVQLLWLNLVTNGIQDVALAFEPGERGALDRPPRPPGEPIFNRLMTDRTVIAAAVMGAVAFGAFFWMLGAGWDEAEARNSVLLLMVLFENIHLGNCRSETISMLRLAPFKSPILLIGAVAAFLIHVGAMHLGAAQVILRTAPVSADQWGALVALALSVAVVMELHKWSWGRTGMRLAHVKGRGGG